MERRQDLLSEEQMQENKEMAEQELEALAMTLSEQEMQVERLEAEVVVSMKVVPERLERMLTVVLEGFYAKNQEQCVKFQEEKHQMEGLLVPSSSVYLFKTAQLPLLHLQLSLLASYPSAAPPKVSLSGFYSKYAEEIRELLQSRWMPEQLVLFDWFSCLQSDLLPLLTQTQLLSLGNIAFQEFREEQLRAVEFHLETRDTQCEICFGEAKGKDKFLVFENCLHFFCKGCLKEYAVQLIEIGQLSKLVCPQMGGCRTIMTEVHLRKLEINEEVLEKVLNFSISQAIENMDDCTWCPKQDCVQIADINKPKNYGRCTRCNFMFCLTCKDKYHFGKRCPALAIQASHLNTKIKPGNDIDQHIGLIQERMNLFFIQRCTKNCPVCGFSIQKIDGCNKMTCSRCGKYFCWACGQRIEGYQHFAESPACGDIINANLPTDVSHELGNDLSDELMEAELVKKAMVSSAECPKCKQINNKTDGINLIQCYKCEKDFCFTCGMALTNGKVHYEESFCHYKDPQT